MIRGLLVGTAVFLAIYLLVVFVRQAVNYKRTKSKPIKPELSFLFLVKNQQDIIEGLVRRIISEAYLRSFEVVAADFGSTDQTKQILQRLAFNTQVLKVVASEGQSIPNTIHGLCQGNMIYCMDLTRPINYSLMVQTIHAIVNGSKTNLYRTRFLQRDLTENHKTNIP